MQNPSIVLAGFCYMTNFRVASNNDPVIVKSVALLGCTPPKMAANLWATQRTNHNFPDFTLMIQCKYGPHLWDLNPLLGACGILDALKGAYDL